MIKDSINKKEAMTLTELMIATALIGIVMVGALSIDFAVRSTRRNTAESTGLALRTYALMNTITNNAQLAIGDADNFGMWQDVAPNRHNFCFRQDTLITPADYTDDVWACFWRNNETIYTCDRTAAQGPGACATTDREIGQVANLGAGNYAFTPIVTLDTINNIVLFSIDLTCQVDPNAAYDPLSNPSFRLQAQVVPPGHGI